MILAIDADPIQHEKLKEVMNNRKYGLNKFRAGYNIPHISEVRLYNIRCKKEIVPFLMRDLSARNMLKTDDLLHTVNQTEAVPTGKRKKAPLKIRIAAWTLRKFLKAVGISVPPPPAGGTKMNFVEGWTYVYCFGILNDLETEWGEWL